MVLFSSCLRSGGSIFELVLVGWWYFRVGSSRVVLFSSWIRSGGAIFELGLVGLCYFYRCSTSIFVRTEVFC